ncbi:acyl-CoA dehydrogenase family protein [Chelativorans sp. AA-79]|uniref:acyl-CoA dehydrogenase family protein n=1 Tax=Chelativorans sp. AA-79 TaxID=3028735 RepID=UPI0023F816F9|nr:acyl-CoA dehydrogenase family protein [Chelativorans sp. AA-79]WEX10540.1 acyl-CoA dehydrogenase family protein [Chelativorans sp. AA-79]
MGFSRQAEISSRLLEISSAWAEVRAGREEIDADLARMILGGAAQFAESRIEPLAAVADREGCGLREGRVITPPGYRETWQALCETGWLGLDLPAHAGGPGLPLTLHTAAQMLFDRASPAFVMVAGATRSAAFVVNAFGDEEARREWLPRLVSGEWSATICISEPDAGSDVGRIRTRAEEGGDGLWRISGQKCWISFGDHDLTARIGHLLLARTGEAEEGTRGLSLFLVPDQVVVGSGGFRRNGITVERIEEKLGLHGSPTCVLRFNGAEGILLGEVHRGLPQLFLMIERMRLLTAGQGAATAIAAVDIAERYAQERRQGGAPEAPPVPIIAHADVQRQLAGMAARTYALHAFVLELAAVLDLAETGAEDQRALAAWLMPIAKNFGAETGFDAASAAIQVLGGAGYTKEWPAERLLRDSRILSIFEGTTGMQALDLLHRRLWKDEGRGLRILAERIRHEVAQAGDRKAAGMAVGILERLEALAEHFSELKTDRRTAETGADAFFRAAWAATFAWMSLRLVSLLDSPRDDLDRHLGALGRYGLCEAEAEMHAAEARSRIPADLVCAPWRYLAAED